MAQDGCWLFNHLIYNVGWRRGARQKGKQDSVATSFFFLINLFIYSFLAALDLRCCVQAFSLVAASGGYSSLRCAGFSLRWLLLLRSMGSRHVGFSSCGSQALERRLSSCGARASLLRGMWDLPGPGLEPVFPALAGGFLTTAPPGKSATSF